MKTMLLVRKLGISANYRGYRFLVTAIELALEDETCLSSLGKSVYPTISQKFGVSQKAVESSLRRVIDHCWYRGDRTLLKNISCCELTKCPDTAQFLDILAFHLRQSEEKALAEAEAVRQQTV